MAWHTTIYEREKLYQEVWTEPVRDVARRYGLSDVGLAKICQKLGVPVPSRGFWARKAAGEAVKQEPLPPLRRGEVAEHRVERWRDPLDDVPIGSEAEQLLAREDNEELRVVVQPDLASPHPLIRRYAGLLRKSSKKKEPMPVRLQQPCLAIAATGEALERALRVADALLRAFDKRGFPVDVTDPERPTGREYVSRREITPSTTGVEVLESRIEFEIVELRDTIKIEPDATKRRGTYGLSPGYSSAPEYEHRPNGKLTLKITNHHWTGSRLTWSDGKTQRVEECLNDFIGCVIRAAERKRLQRLENERQERERHEAELRREEEERRRQHEAELIYDLDSRVDDWQRAHAIREFLAGVAADARASNTEMSPEFEFRKWLAWAREYVDDLEEDAVKTILELRPSPPRSHTPW